MSIKIVSIKIANASSADYKEVAALHQKCITEGFLSTLGVPFLSALYQGISEVGNSGVFIAREAGNVLGFLAYTGNVKTCYRTVLASRWSSLTSSMLPNAFRLSIYRRVIETLLYPFVTGETRRESEEPAKANSGPRAELLSMAVDDEARGKGVGKKLVAAMDDAMRRIGITTYYVVTHGVDTRSNCFYLACGFEKLREFKIHGKPMNEYCKILT